MKGDCNKVKIKKKQSLKNRSSPPSECLWQPQLQHVLRPPEGRIHAVHDVKITRQKNGVSKSRPTYINCSPSPMCRFSSTHNANFENKVSLCESALL